MEIRVPMFAGRRILKKESLWDIRDYTYAGWQLYYAEYTDGLLKGCDIRAEDGQLVIGNIMVVAQGRNDTTRDSFGRNDWNFVIDFDNFCVQKKSITQ